MKANRPRKIFCLLSILVILASAPIYLNLIAQAREKEEGSLGMEEEPFSNKGYIFKKDVPESVSAKPIKSVRDLVEDIILIGNIDLYGVYSRVIGGKGIWGLMTSVVISPVIKFNDLTYLIPLYSGSYKKERQIISVEEGGRLYSHAQSHNLSLALKRVHTPRLSTRTNLFVSWNLYRETADESWTEGLYDYRDRGIGVDFRYTAFEAEDKSGAVNFGGQYYRRDYPNFKSLLSLAFPTASEVHEKNYDGCGATIGYEFMNVEGLSWDASYSCLLKFFTDKKVIGPDGVLQDKKREDNVHTINLNVTHQPKVGFGWGLDSEFALNLSNQNFYDSRDTPSLADDVFTPDYFDYYSIELEPNITYTHKLKEDKELRLKFGYTFMARDYLDRKVQASDGSYKDEDQTDWTHNLSATVSYPITEKLRWAFLCNYSINESNMKYEKYYRYDYDIYHILTGFSYEF